MMHRVFSHTGVRWITLGWAAFIGENLVLSHNRDAIIEQFGRSVYFNTYGTLSTAASASIVYGYWRHGRRQGPLLPTIKSKLAAHTASKKLVATACRIRSTPVAVASAAILQFIGLGLLSQLMPRVQIPFEYSYVTKHEMSQTESESTKNQPSLLVPPKAENGQTSATLMTKQWIFRCPFDFSKNEESSNVSDGDDELYTGVYRITRHPGLWGLGLFGLGSAFLRPFITEILFFSLPALFALIGGAHQVCQKCFVFRCTNKCSNWLG